MNDQQIPHSADYIIVGGGTAGLVLAARLSEIPNKSIIVLEGGKNLLQDPRVDTPGLWTTLIGSDADWKLQSVPQLGLGGRVIKETQGKMLGGSSGINGQAFIAASQVTIDAWSQLGNNGWNWENLLPYFKKAYTINLPDNATKEHLGLEWIDGAVHGTSGPIQVSFPATIQNPLAKAWVNAFKSLGYNATVDPYSGYSVGGYNSLAAVDPTTKTRSYAASGYGILAMKKPGVHIITEAVVQQVLLEGLSPNLRAIGVKAVINGQTHIIKARKEVIISSGAFNTPKLLELSGIGNQNILEKLGIQVMIHNPNVGENLQDHLMSGISFEAVDGVITGDPILRQEPEAVQAAIKSYAEHREGPMTIGGVQSSAFMPLLEFDGPDGAKAQKALFDSHLRAAIKHHKVVRELLDRPKETSCSMFMFLAQANLHEPGKSFVGSNLLPGNYISLGIIQSLPLSRGEVHISSADPKEPQIIDPKYFSHPLDLEIMARNLIDVERLHKTKALSQYLKPNGRRNHPDAYLTDLESAKKYLQDTATTSYHSCGTAAMLPQDQGGVVNEKLLVYGTSNLRICDASIFPLIPRANTMATVYAVAERGADIIKADA